MLRHLMISACLLCATCAIAQSDKNTEKQAASEIDYKLIGAPMPKLFLVTYHDTAAKKDGQKKTAAKETGNKKKRNRSSDPEPNLLQPQYITGKDLDNGANLFVMLFNPTCSHCEDQTIQFEKNKELFKKTKIVLMANMGMKDYLPDFIKTLHTDDYPYMYVGADSSGFVGEIFLYSAIPQINIYSPQRKLLRTFTGGAPMDSLKQYIQ